MSTRRILEAFERWRTEQAPLVLVTVVDTEGSTYTKAGHRILINGAGGFQGLVSGGCLEGDLAEHAREVLGTGRAQLLTYDLRDEHDGIFGLGIGCNGLFRVLLQPVDGGHGYAPFAAIAAGLLGEAPGCVATVVESTDPALLPGATLVTGADTESARDLPEDWRAALRRGCLAHRDAPRACVAGEAVAGLGARVLYAPLRPLPRLLVLGAGLDAVALVEIARQLGWRVTVADHRPAYLARGDLGAADHVQQLVPAELARSVELARYTAVVVMSHHLVTDRSYLAALAATSVPYIGLLGPRARRDRLLADLGASAAGLGRRLHAPIGLPIGADSPETIALAILAEIHATLAGRLDLVAAGR